jgi:hypothetical protein
MNYFLIYHCRNSEKYFKICAKKKTKCGYIPRVNTSLNASIIEAEKEGDANESKSEEQQYQKKITFHKKITPVSLLSLSIHLYDYVRIVLAISNEDEIPLI